MIHRVRAAPLPLLVAVAVCTPTLVWAQPPPQPAQPAPAGTYDPSMQAGGLAPPPPMTSPSSEPPPSSGTTEQRLDRAKDEDAGRGLNWLWVDVEGGFQHVGLKTFSVDEESLTAGFLPTTSSGGVIGAGLGLQLLFITLGPRARVGFFSDWQLFSLGGELGLRIPIGRLEPHVSLGAGYTALGGLTEDTNAITITGFYGRLGGGLDVYVNEVFSLGGNFSWELLGLTRPGIGADELESVDDSRAAQLQVEGTSYGSAIALTLVAGLHF
jgi:hypothetical protein